VRRYLVVDDSRELAENLAEILRDTGALLEAVERLHRPGSAA